MGFGTVHPHPHPATPAVLACGARKLRSDPQQAQPMRFRGAAHVQSRTLGGFSALSPIYQRTTVFTSFSARMQKEDRGRSASQHKRNITQGGNKLLIPLCNIWSYVASTPLFPMRHSFHSQSRSRAECRLPFGQALCSRHTKPFP